MSYWELLSQFWYIGHIQGFMCFWIRLRITDYTQGKMRMRRIWCPREPWSKAFFFSKPFRPLLLSFCLRYELLHLFPFPLRHNLGSISLSHYNRINSKYDLLDAANILGYKLGIITCFMGIYWCLWWWIVIRFKVSVYFCFAEIKKISALTMLCLM